MGASPGQALAKLRVAAEDGRLEAVCRRHDIRLLTVFGSAVRPVIGDGPRDVDVAVHFDAGRRGDQLAVIDELVQLTGSNDIDLAVLDHAGPLLRERALVGCVALYESEPHAYANAQMAAIGERMDTDWLRELDLRLMAR